MILDIMGSNETKCDNLYKYILLSYYKLGVHISIKNIYLYDHILAQCIYL